MRKEPVYKYYGDSRLWHIISPYPYNHRLVFSGNYGGRIVKTGYSLLCRITNMEKCKWIIINICNITTRPCHIDMLIRNHYPSVMDDLLVQSASLDMLPLINNYTASWQTNDCSVWNHREVVEQVAQFHIKVTIQDGVANYYLGDQRAMKY